MAGSNDDVLYLSLATIVAGLVGVVTRYFFKSRCIDFTCCYGLIKVKRDAQAENAVEISQIEHGIKEDTAPSV